MVINDAQVSGESGSMTYQWTSDNPSVATVSGVSHGEFSTYPIEVTVGGATLFILSVDQFLKI